MSVGDEYVNTKGINWAHIGNQIIVKCNFSGVSYSKCVILIMEVNITVW